MRKGSDQNAELIDRLRAMQSELVLVSKLTKDLSSILSKDQLTAFFQRTLKAEFTYDGLSLITNSGDTYNLFYSSGNIQHSGSSHPYFQKCIESAEPRFFDLKEISGSQQDLFNSAKNSGMRTAVGFCLPAFEKNINLLFLFYKNFISPDEFPERLLKGISTQLSITIRNINFTERFKNIQESAVPPSWETENREMQNADPGFYGIVGTSAVMQEIFSQISQVAPSQSTVIIYGETGTGKELIAQAVHQLSEYSHKKMIRINCAAIPSNLIESELFGHEKGSFTGATEQRKGKFEQAHNSTIFLDEIGELPIELQGRLLRVLQERKIERIGGDRRIKVNARVIAATNRNLEKDVAEGKFRSDLYYRLNVFPIHLPALRERKEDIPLLAEYFLEKLYLKTGKKIHGFSRKALQSMLEHSWPGNIRELENTIERSMLTAKDKTIKEMGFPQLSQPYDIQDFQIKTLQEFEKEYILKVLEKCNGKIFGEHGAAKLLGLPPTTLISKMQKLGIEKKHSFKDHPL